MKVKRTTAGLLSCRRTLRLSPEEDRKLTQQAELAGLSISEYMRRRFFGGRPITAKADAQTVRELRRLGGLLKHNFETVRQAEHQTSAEEMNAVLRQIGCAVDSLSK